MNDFCYIVKHNDDPTCKRFEKLGSPKKNVYNHDRKYILIRFTVMKQTQNNNIIDMAGCVLWRRCGYQVRIELFIQTEIMMMMMAMCDSMCSMKRSTQNFDDGISFFVCCFLH